MRSVKCVCGIDTLVEGEMSGNRTGNDIAAMIKNFPGISVESNVLFLSSLNEFT